MLFVIACKKGFINGSRGLDDGMSLPQTTASIRDAKTFLSYEEASQYMAGVHSGLGHYSIMTSPVLLERKFFHEHMYFLATKFGFILDLQKKRYYHNENKELHVFKSVSDVRGATPFPSFEAAENYMDNCVLGKKWYAVLVSAYRSARA